MAPRPLARGAACRRRPLARARRGGRLRAALNSRGSRPASDGRAPGQWAPRSPGGVVPGGRRGARGGSRGSPRKPESGPDDTVSPGDRPPWAPGGGLGAAGGGDPSGTRVLPELGRWAGCTVRAARGSGEAARLGGGSGEQPAAQSPPAGPRARQARPSRPAACLLGGGAGAAAPTSPSALRSAATCRRTGRSASDTPPQGGSGPRLSLLGAAPAATGL